MIFGSFSLSRTFLLPWFGRMSDRRGRKPFIVGGLLMYALISIAFIFSRNVMTLITIRFFQGIASAMIMPVTQAYIGDITPKGREGFFSGLFSMSMFLSLSIGPLLGGVINARFGLNTTFACMGLLSLCAFLLAYIFLPARKSEHPGSCGKSPVRWRYLLTDRLLNGLFIIRMCYTTCIGVIWSFLPVFADAEFQLSSSAIGFLLMTGVLTSGLLQTPMGWLADRGRQTMMMMAGSLIVSCGILYYEWAGNFGDLFVASALFGLGGGITMPALMAIAVKEGNRIDAMGSVMGMLTMAHSLGMLLGAILAGVMMDYFELRHAFPFAALIMMTGLIIYSLISFSMSIRIPAGLPKISSALRMPLKAGTRISHTFHYFAGFIKK
jgi:MFS family permease